MSLARYRAQIAEWEKVYGKPKQGPFRWNPADIRTACVKCGKQKKKMSRHHICSDFLFACMRPDLYALRYMEFRKEDCAKLCSKCHIAVENYNDPIQQRMLQEYQMSTCTPEWCEKWRKIFREAFDKWLKAKPRKKRR